MPAKRINNQKPMTIKSKLTTLSVVAAIVLTSSVAAFASSMPLDYETATARHLEMTGEELPEEMFNKRQEARELMQAGDREGAKAIRDELAIEFPDMGNGMGHMHGKGFMKGSKGPRGEFRGDCKLNTSVEE